VLRVLKVLAVLRVLVLTVLAVLRVLVLTVLEVLRALSSWRWHLQHFQHC